MMYAHGARRQLKYSLLLAIVAQMTLTISPKQAVADTTVADQEHSREEDETAYCAWFSLQEESDQIQNNEHYVCLHKRWICWFRDQQNRNQTLQTVHGGSASHPFQEEKRKLSVNCLSSNLLSTPNINCNLKSTTHTQFLCCCALLL